MSYSLSSIHILKNLLLKTATQSGYIGEPVSKASHMFSAALTASNQQRSNPVIVASLFHDIGHLLAEDDTGGYGVSNHAELGSAFLKGLGFPDSVCLPVKYHVDAKRYLISISNNYQLSLASQETLKFQGGPMNMKEIKQFEQNPFFNSALQVRQADENSKVKEYDHDLLNKTFNNFIPILVQLIED